MSEALEQTDVETPDDASWKTQHAKVLRFEVSIGKDDDDRTIEQFEDDIRDALALTPASGGFPPTNVTMMGGYYIIDGKVCLTADYDPAAKNRKPGTFPPAWAGGPDPKKKSTLYQVNDDDERATSVTVRDLYPEGYKKPERNEFGRRVRKDKGVKRGPRQPKNLDEAADNVLQQIKGSGATKKR